MPYFAGGISFFFVVGYNLPATHERGNARSIEIAVDEPYLRASAREGDSEINSYRRLPDSTLT